MTELKNDPHKIMQRARILLLRKQPFFSSLALDMQMVPDESIPTMGTNYKTIYYNPQFVMELYGKNPSLIEAAVAHECGHKYLMHDLRRGGRDWDLWNQAGDYVINILLRDCGFEIDGDWLINDKYRGWSSEQVYNDLKQNPDKQESESNGHKQCASGCTQPPKGSGPGESLTADEAHKMEQAIKADIARAANQARMRGHIPHALASQIEAILNPPEPWQDILREFITNRARDDYNWMRPNRSHLGRGIVMPSLYNYRMGEIVVALDTSGSVNHHEFAAFMNNLSSIIEDCRPEAVHVLHVDAGIHHAETYTVEDLPLPATRYGCGGTSFRPPFKWVEQQDIDPECLIYFTDTMGDFPAEPDYPVLWAGVGDNVSVPWGELIEVTADA